LLGAFVFAGFQLSLGFLLAFPCLILVHELGHGFIAARLGHRVVGIEATGLGGICRWSGNASPFEEALIAWGGVLAQLVLFLGTELWLWGSAGTTSTFGWQVVSAFTHTNLRLMAINLLPIPPLDGARAWTIFSAWKERSPTGIPYGTWRDHSPNAQGAWFAGGKAQKQGRAQRQREPSTVMASPPASAPPSDDGQLDSESQRVIDALLRRATGKARGSDEGEA